MIMNNNIPFLDLITPHQELKEELSEVFTKALSYRGLHRRSHGGAV